MYRALLRGLPNSPSILHFRRKCTEPLLFNFIFQPQRYTATNLQHLEIIKELRNRTGVSIGRCKEALNYCNWDLDEARMWIKGNGILSNQKANSRNSNEGVVGLQQNERAYLLLKIVSNTDFVCKNELFLNAFEHFLDEIISEIHSFTELTSIHDINQIVLKQKIDHRLQGNTIGEVISELCQIFHERISLQNFAVELKSSNSVTRGYIHNKIRANIGQSAALSTLYFNSLQPGITEPPMELIQVLKLLARQISIQLVANGPQYIHNDQVPKDRLAKEIEIIKANTGTQVKSANLKQIIKLKTASLYKELCLLSQDFLLQNQLINFLEDGNGGNGIDHTVIDFLKSKHPLTIDEVLIYLKKKYNAEIKLINFTHIGLMNEFTRVSYD